MNHILPFFLFEEVNPRDIAFIESMDDYFTTSFEFEIETDDKSNIKMDFNILDDDIVGEIIDIVVYEMCLTRKKDKDLVEDLIYSVIDSKENNINYEILNNIFNSDNFRTNREREIASFTKSILISYIRKEDFSYIKKQAKKYLPNFTSKWSSLLDYVEDTTLERGIEIKPKKYLTTLSEGIQMIEDFYDDLSKQDYWKFSSKTGLHINIGTNKENIEWNPIKGLVMMNDFNESGNTPYVFKNMTWRFNNDFCGSLISSIKKMDKESINKLKESIDLHNVKLTESILNEFLSLKIREWGDKNFGFNLTKLDFNYVEFRYVGGEITKDVLIEKLKYFSFIVYVMTNPDYKRKEYLKKLYKFIDNL